MQLVPERYFKRTPIPKPNNQTSIQDDKVQMTVKVKELLNQARKINKLLLDAHHKAQQPCTGVKAKTSTTPPNRFFDILEQELHFGNHERKQAMEDLELLLQSLAEKRRLTVDWRGGMMSHSELIKVTARRVGLAAPELSSDRKE